MKFPLHSAIVVLAALFSTSAMAGSDTLYMYFDKEWKPCAKEAATYYGKAYKEGDVWFRKDYWVRGNVMQMAGTFADKEFETRVGKFKYYSEKGNLSSELSYVDGKQTAAIYYYEDGKKQAESVTREDGTTAGKGWDESGKIIEKYIVEKEAQFPGGAQGWRKYLEKNLDTDVPSKSKAPVGVHKVLLQFIVTKEGNVSDIKVLEAPKKCKGCTAEAIRVIEQGPGWEPAVQLNKKVNFYAHQAISFVVNEE